MARIIQIAIGVAALTLLLVMIVLMPAPFAMGLRTAIGVAAYDMGSPGLAAIVFRPLADAGNARGENNLAVLLDRGEGAAANPLEAALLYRSAAEQGLAVAAYNLAQLYKRGRGIRKDEARAIVLYEQASEQGDVFAKVALADWLGRHSFYSAEDQERVRDLLRAAAEAGNVDAQHEFA
jgi:TPR repeat protein